MAYRNFKLALGVAGAMLMSQPALAADNVRLGVIMPTSGTSAKSGQETLEAVRFAVDLINNAYDIDMPFARTAGLPAHGGAKIELIVEDHGGRPERGAAIAERMITEEKVHILQGAFHSSVCAPASQAAEKYGIPFVTGTSESPALTERGLHTFFSVTPTGSDIARDFLTFLKDVSAENNVALKSISVMHVNDVWGSGLAKAAEAIYGDFGYNDISQVSYPPNVSDLKAEVLKLKSINADVLLQASFDADAILAVKTYQALQFQPKAILAMGASFSTPEFINALGKNANYNFAHTKFHAALLGSRKGAAKVAAEYEKRVGRSLWDAPARAFTATLVIADALNRAKSMAPEDIITALKATDIKGEDTISPYRGIRFNAKGQNELANGLITQVRDGKHVAVWPAEIAEQKAVFPMPPWNQR